MFHTREPGGTGNILIPAEARQFVMNPISTNPIRTLLLTTLSLFIVVSSPLSQELKTPNTLREESHIALPQAVRADLKKRLEGSWKLAGYYAWDKDNGEYIEVAIRKEKIDETRESWLLRPNGSFRHIMGENLFFTGKWAVPKRVGAATESPKPRYLALVLDVSGTMKGVPITEAKRAAKALVKRLGPQDHVALITVGNQAKVTPFSSQSRDGLLKAIEGLKARDNKTTLHDGVTAAIDSFKTTPGEAIKSIVVLSDGKDEGSKADFLTCLTEAEEAGIPIHSVGYTRIEKKYTASLKALSRATEGAFSEVVDAQLLFSIMEETFAQVLPKESDVGYFLLHTTQVNTSFMQKRENDYFVGTFMDQGRNLVIFYVGTSLDYPENTFFQASIFEKAPYGAR